jgi:hypothetical protein
VRLADLNADGEHRLLIADSDKKLKIYKGARLSGLLSALLLLARATLTQAHRLSPSTLCWTCRPRSQPSTPT